MRGHHWYVWDADERVLCEGSYAKCKRLYMHLIRTMPDIRLGYVLFEVAP